MALAISADGGVTWQPPREIAPPPSGEFDAQIVVDPVDQRTVYAAWLQNEKKDTVVAKSSDFGQSWSIVIANHAEDTDKPTLAVRGSDVYVAFNHDRTLWVSASHDGGVSFYSSTVPAPAVLDWSLPNGGTIDAAGNVSAASSTFAVTIDTTAPAGGAGNGGNAGRLPSAGPG